MAAHVSSPYREQNTQLFIPICPSLQEKLSGTCASTKQQVHDGLVEMRAT